MTVSSPSSSPQQITVLGATGSIGTSTLDVIARHPGQFQVFALSAATQTDKMLELCRRFSPRFAVMASEPHAQALRDACRAHGLSVEVLSGESGLVEVSRHPEVDAVMAAIVGAAGLAPCLAAARAGKRLLLANKEALVVGGRVFLDAVQQGGATLLPIDSEHSAIFQSLPDDPATWQQRVEKIILTASGGPFRSADPATLKSVTPEQACAHPNWSMGRKISVDSATLMNKGLEFIEAKWLFDMPIDAIDIVVHRESVVHSAIAYQDNSVIAQLGVPDMRIPIQYALTCPRRLPSPVQELSLVDYGKLTFYAPDYDTFRCINVCKDAIAAGGLRPAAANGANEESVRLFLNGKIKFTDIAVLNRAAMEACPQVADYTLDDVLQADRAARDYVIEAVS